ncbi:MAG: hypothetical protein JOZ78_17960 [Chroococcidiopsidaceae cyanobacterium CP_BM_ER_R8_30]|nr:hypothetical protein [Chroococcidiopsidaceae cyanobacterium CP_BM_ER_R8_30]
MDSSPEDKLIKKSAAVAGIALVAAVIGISAFSQWKPNAVLNKPSYNRGSVAQSPSRTQAIPNVFLATPSPASKASSTAVFKGSATVPRTIVPSSSTLTPVIRTTASSAIISHKSAVTSSSSIPPHSVSTPSVLPVSRIEPTERTSIATHSSSIRDAKRLEREIDDANATAVGLVVAKREGRIKPYSPMWRKAQDAIFLLRHGETRRQAARQAGIPKTVLMRLLKWGQNRPGTNGHVAKF